jgi:hypothetical protein
MQHLVGSFLTVGQMCVRLALQNMTFSVVLNQLIHTMQPYLSSTLLPLTSLAVVQQIS